MERLKFVFMVRKDNTKNNTKKSLSSSQLIPVGFLLLILAGTLLLCLPFSTVEGEKTSVLTALFTATTSTCVTGLVVVNTFSHWTLFGQAVILMLIQFGGMGIVAITALVMILARRKLTMANRVLLMDSFNLDTPGGVVRFLRKVFVGVFIVESIGALLYSFYFILSACLHPFKIFRAGIQFKMTPGYNNIHNILRIRYRNRVRYTCIII